MRWLCILVVSSIGSSVGWWAGESVGMGTALLLSSIGGIAGIYGGWKLAKYFEGG